MDQFTIWLASTGRAGGRRAAPCRPRSASPARSATCTSPTSRMPTPRTRSPTPAAPGTTTAATQASPWRSTGGARHRTSAQGQLPDCQEIQFITADILDGPVHFNDMPLINGNTQFRQGFTTYRSTAPRPPTTSASAAKTGCFRGSGHPVAEHARAHGGPTSNPLPDTTGDLVNKPGCQYTGDTRIRFNSNGTMDVWNTMSAGTTIGFVGQPRGDRHQPRTAGCAAHFTPATGQKYPAAKQTVPVPDGLVIYVKSSTVERHLRPRPGRQRHHVGQCDQGRDPARVRTSERRRDRRRLLHPTWRRTKSSSALAGHPPCSRDLPTQERLRSGQCVRRGNGQRAG